MSDTCVVQTWILQNTAGKSRNAKSLQEATWRDSQREAGNVASVGLPPGKQGPDPAQAHVDPARSCSC